MNFEKWWKQQVKATKETKGPHARDFILQDLASALVSIDYACKHAVLARDKSLTLELKKIYQQVGKSFDDLSEDSQ